LLSNAFLDSKVLTTTALKFQWLWSATGISIVLPNGLEGHSGLHMISSSKCIFLTGSVTTCQCIAKLTWSPCLDPPVSAQALAATRPNIHISKRRNWFPKIDPIHWSMPTFSTHKPSNWFAIILHVSKHSILGSYHHYIPTMC
jgi:hypothetical protein